ncbi:MAG: shikimate dehydrogenase [Thermoprotei archaeon]
METDEAHLVNEEKPLNYYIIGYPINHSISPKVYNKIFKIWNINAKYSALSVKPDELSTKIVLLKSQNAKGFNVTIPHKVAIMDFLHEITYDAELIGAVNTVINKNGKLIGFNTDAIGFLNALKHHVSLSFSKSAIIGAGGAARAAIYELSKYSDEIHVFSLSGDSAINTANYFRRIGFNVIGHKANTKCYSEILPSVDLIVNASPVGMLNQNEIPIPPEFLKEGMIVMDMVYNPLVTKLIRTALEKNCKVIDGLWMLVYQVIENLNLWFGFKPSEILVRVIGERYLTGDYHER